MKKTLAFFAALALCAGIASADKCKVLMISYKENGKTLEQIEKIAEMNGGDFKLAVQICKDARAGKNPATNPNEMEMEDGYDLVDKLKDYGIEAVVCLENGVWVERPILKNKKGKSSTSSGKGKK